MNKKAYSLQIKIYRHVKVIKGNRNHCSKTKSVDVNHGLSLYHNCRADLVQCFKRTTFFLCHSLQCQEIKSDMSFERNQHFFFIEIIITKYMTVMQVLQFPLFQLKHIWTNIPNIFFQIPFNAFFLMMFFDAFLRKWGQ